MKLKIIPTICTVLFGILAVSKFAYATSTAFSLPSMGDLLGYAIDTSNPFLTAFWPIIGALLGLGFVGFVIGKFTNRF